MQPGAVVPVDPGEDCSPGIGPRVANGRRCSSSRLRLDQNASATELSQHPGPPDRVSQAELFLVGGREVLDTPVANRFCRSISDYRDRKQRAPSRSSMAN